MLDANMELKPSETEKGGIDNLVIEIKAIIRTNEATTKVPCISSPSVMLETPNMIVEKTFQFVACDIGYESINSQQQQQNSDPSGDLTTEFSL